MTASGGKGVFEKIQRNIQNLRVAAQKGESIPEIILMCVLTEDSINRLPEILEAFSALYPDEVILQDMISLEETEITQYKNGFKIVLKQRLWRLMPGKAQMEAMKKEQKSGSTVNNI